MTVQQIEKISRDISSLKQNINSLRSLLVGQSIKDKEGDYSPEFTRDIIKLSYQKSTHSFKGKEIFLNDVKNS